MNPRRGPAPHGHVTLADVARAAGVSPQSVSNALNRPDQLAPATRDRILSSVRQLGYRPNRSARTLRSRRSHLLAVKVEPSNDRRAAFLLDEFLHALTRAAGAAGNHVLLCEATDEESELAAYQDLMAGTAIDGVVLDSAHHGDRRVRTLRSWKVPCAVFGRSWDADADVAWADVDGRDGLLQATRHLIERGHREIAHLGWPHDSSVGHDRRSGWQQACREAGLPARLDVAVEDDFEAAYAASRHLLDADPAPTAVVCSSDTLALALLRAATERGVLVGRDLALTGFDDSPTAALVSPSLTSLRQPLEEVAQHLVAALEAQIHGEPGPPRQLLLPPRLVVRESSRCGPTP